MAAFYPLPRCRFYMVRRFHGDGFIIVFLRPPIGSEVKKIVHWMPEVLFAAEIAFRCLHGCMPEEELNLLKLTTAVVTQFRAGPPQVVRGNVLQSGFLATGSDHVPDNVLGDATAPHLSESGDRSKDFALAHASGSCPLVQSGLDPCGNGHCANVATFADQINHGPVSLAHLGVVELQANQFRSAKTTTKQHGQHRIIALRSHTFTTSVFEYFRTLLCAQPITGTESELLNSFDTADPGSQLRTQQTGVSGFVS